LSGFRRVASDVRKVRELSERPRLGMRWVHPVSRARRDRGATRRCSFCRETWAVHRAGA
jgi:hypothetical protein